FGEPASTPLVRLHSECVTGDLLGSLCCDCGFQLDEAMRLLDHAGGWLLYLRQEGRGIGLTGKIDAYRLQQRGLDTYAANQQLGFPDDARDYDDAIGMLRALAISELHLLTGNPDKVAALTKGNVKV